MIEKRCGLFVVLALAVSLSLTAGSRCVMAEPSEQNQVSTTAQAQQRLRTPVTYSGVNEPIENVLMALAEQAKIDIVKSPKVTGIVTVKLVAVPLGEALTNILAANDCTYIATDNMVRVIPLPEIAAIREPLDTRIYQITYADANEVAIALTKFVSDRGKVALNKGTNHLMVTDTEDKIKVMDKFIAKIDSITPQILVEVQIYEITNNEGFEIGTEWAVGRNTPLKTTQHTNTRINTDSPTSLTETTTTVTGPSSTVTGPSSTSYSDSTGSSSTTGSNRIESGTSGESSTSSATSSLNRRDYDTDSLGNTVGNIQNRIENTTSGGNSSSSTTSGLNRSDTTNSTGSTVGSGSTTDSGRTDTDTGRTNTETKVTQLPVGTYYDTTTESYMTRKRNPYIGGSFDAQTGGTLRLSLLDNAVDLQLALRALSREVEAKLLANPRVLVLDNETANFEIVREIPYRELQQIGRADPITYTAFKNVGIQLKVTPHVAAGGMIRLRISPQFGMVVSQSVDGVPTVDTRRADTTAMLKDGQTIVIGGLRKREVNKAVSKVPILGDMPIVGGLFRSQTEAAQINELVVFITTRIVREPALSDSEKQQLRISQIGTRDIKDIEAERELTEMLLESLTEQK